jgi:thiol-disulfide isomerase/thioredoxin
MFASKSQTVAMQTKIINILKLLNLKSSCKRKYKKGKTLFKNSLKKFEKKVQEKDFVFKKLYKFEQKKSMKLPSNILLTLVVVLVTSSFKSSAQKEVFSSTPHAKLPSHILLEDTNGAVVSLSDFKGKFLIIDFWASWCSPCMAEMHHIEKLQEKFEGEVEWLFINFDEFKEDWKKSIKRHSKIKGKHLFAGKRTKMGKQVKEEFDLGTVNSLPFYLWINSYGDIVYYKAPLPSMGIEYRLKRYLKENSELNKMEGE